MMQFIIDNRPDELARIYQLLARAYFEQEQFDKTLENLNKALKLIPNQTKVLNGIAIIMSKSEEPEKAIEYWKRSLQIESPSEVEQAGIIQFYEMHLNLLGKR